MKLLVLSLLILSAYSWDPQEDGKACYAKKCYINNVNNIYPICDLEFNYCKLESFYDIPECMLGAAKRQLSCSPEQLCKHYSETGEPYCENQRSDTMVQGFIGVAIGCVALFCVVVAYFGCRRRLKKPSTPNSFNGIQISNRVELPSVAPHACQGEVNKGCEDAFYPPPAQNYYAELPPHYDAELPPHYDDITDN